jgi:hypothetical protein
MHEKQVFLTIFIIKNTFATILSAIFIKAFGFNTSQHF